jgi:hypothetical protein
MATPEHAYKLRDPQSGEIFTLSGGVWAGENPEAVKLLNGLYMAGRALRADPSRYQADPDWDAAQAAMADLGLILVAQPAPALAVEDPSVVF